MCGTCVTARATDWSWGGGVYTPLRGKTTGKCPLGPGQVIPAKILCVSNCFPLLLYFFHFHPKWKKVGTINHPCNYKQSHNYQQSHIYKQSLAKNYSGHNYKHPLFSSAREARRRKICHLVHNKKHPLAPDFSGQNYQQGLIIIMAGFIGEYVSHL